MTSNIDGDNEMQAQATLEAQADELLKPYDGIYTDKQLRRKEREFKSRIESRRIINVYVSEDFTDVDNTLIESMLGDIKDAANRAKISDEDYEMVCMRIRKMTYQDISAATGIPVSSCFVRLKEAQQKILNVECFGKWEDLLEMERCIQSNWYKMFRELIEYAEMINNGRR